ncbi:gamma-butyrobetaine dioxygenase-like [Oratosquilla oratoria]|uniref:gamma-butyrobetaine dioxygenase-like n=1 Tax=Oratosquilla oratoria TaxID=337810 RepID=UPI003F7711AD
MLTSQVLRVTARATSSLLLPSTQYAGKTIPRTVKMIARSFQRSTPAFLQQPTQRDGFFEAASCKHITHFEVGPRSVKVEFFDGEPSEYPYVWLRENCQCSSCFNASAIARAFLLEELDLTITPKDVQLLDGNIHVEWHDGHVGVYKGDWLHHRSFKPAIRAAKRSHYMLSKELWSAKFGIPEISFVAAFHDDQVILDWLVALERYGVVLIKGAPLRPKTINQFIDRLGFVKPTHYGLDYELKTEVSPNNLAYTGCKLGLHTDLPYYDYAPGTTWLHCIRQHEGKGGDNDLSDGFFAASVLQKEHPAFFDFLSTKQIYFQDQGVAMYRFNKLTKWPTIVLDNEGQMQRINVSSQSRDSIMDLDVDEVFTFYEAIKTYNDILYENSIRVKLQPGDILVLDNMRVLHGRQPFDSSTSVGCRHFHNAYIDWDELRSRRRVLQDRFGIKFS